MNVNAAHNKKRKAGETKKQVKSDQSKAAEAAQSEAPSESDAQAVKPDMVSFTYLPQSPGLLPESIMDFEGKVTAGPTGPRLRVSVPRHFPTAKPNSDGDFFFTPDDPNFDSANTYVVARQTLEIAQKYAARDIAWSFSEDLEREDMIIRPHAGKNMANAFYSPNNGSINFFSYTDAERNVYRTGMQSDVVSHEVGHAVLDAIRPTYIRSFSVPSGGYHESFGDMLSFIRALHEPDVVDQLKAETQGDLSQSNIASRLAEQLGQTLVGTPSLRDSVNNHKFADQHFLTYLGNKAEDGANSFGTEPHAYANLFTGAFYDMFQAVYAKASADPSATFHEAVAQARDTMGSLLIRATELAPMGNPAYPDMAKAFIQADIIDNEGENVPEITGVFMHRNILNDYNAMAIAEELSDVPKVRFRKSAMTEKGADKFLKDKREKLGLPSDVEFKFENAYKNERGETYINFSSEKLGTLDDPDFGSNEGSRFKGVGGLTLLFDKKGKLLANNHDAVTDREMTNIKNHIRERSLANQFVAFNGHSHHGHHHGHDHEHGEKCNHGHSESLLYTVTNDGNGPILAKAPVVYC